MAQLDDDDDDDNTQVPVVVKPKKVTMTRKEWEKQKRDMKEAQRVREFLEQKEIQEAKRRWVEEFMEPLDEFTMDGYRDFVADADLVEGANMRREERDKVASSMFINHLSEKKRKIRYERLFSLKRAKRLAVMVAMGVEKEAKVLAGKVKEAMVPYDVKVERRIAASLNRIAATDRETEAWLKKRADELAKMEEVEKASKIETRQRKVALEVRDLAAELIMADLARVQEEKRNQRLEKFRAQRRVEAQVRQDAREREEQAEKKAHSDELERIRRWRMRRWAQAAVDDRREAQDRHDARAAHMHAKHAGYMAEDAKEDGDRDADRMEDQTLPPTTSEEAYFASGQRLGVYGTPMGHGDFQGTIGGGHQPGVDDHEPQVFQPTQQYKHEVDKWPLHDLQRKADGKQQLYTHLYTEAQSIAHQVDNFRDTRKRLCADVDQLNQENQVLLNKLVARHPTAAEKKDTHFRKTRIAGVQQEIAEIDTQCQRLETKRKEMDAQCVCVAKDVATLRERVRAMQTQLEPQEGKREALPVVVGRHISKVPGIGSFLGRPQESFNVTVQQSKLEMHKAEARRVARHQKDAVADEMKVWRAQEDRRVSREMLEELMSKLKATQDRVKGQHVDNVKQDLVSVIRLFTLSGEKLWHVEQEVGGMVMWWRCRSEKHCSGDVQAFWSSAREEENGEEEPPQQNDLDAHGNTGEGHRPSTNREGVCLGRAKHGVCAGRFDFPRLDLWTVDFLVTKVDTNLEDQGSPLDYVSIRLGPSPETMVHLGKFFNVVNPDTLCILHEVSFVLRAKTLAYRFEFFSHSNDPRVHMAVLPGGYATKTMDPLEDVDGNRVVSSVVKCMQLASTNSASAHAERILEDITNAQAAQGLTWDSSVLTRFPQRFQRLHYIEKATRELEKVKASLRAQNVRPMLTTLEYDFDDEKRTRRDLRTLKSSNAYIARKRAQHAQAVHECLGCKGQWVMVYNEHSHAWDQYHVLDVRVRWTDQVDPCMRFKLQRYNEWKEAVGSQVVMDLRHTRYHQIPEPVRDEVSYKLYNEGRKKQVELTMRLQETNKRFDEEQKLLQELNDENAVLEAERIRQRKLAMLRVEVEAEADAKLRDPEFCKTLWVNVAAVVEEMKMGLFKDPNGKPYTRPNEVVATQEAHRRWKVEYVAVTLLRMEDDMIEEEEERREEMRRQARRIDKLRKHNEKRVDKHAKVLAKQQDTLTRARVREMAEQRMASLRPLLAIPGFDRAVVGRGGRHAGGVGGVGGDGGGGADVGKRSHGGGGGSGGGDGQQSNERHTSTGDANNGGPCEHLVAKAWGGRYGKGIKCVDCGKDLTDTFEDPGQQKGVGFGEDTHLVEMVTRHRQHSPRFRFQTSEELARVEAERRRLEKERREMYEMQTVFYDLQDLKAIYQFDRRHKNYFKDCGVFRQGVQWTEREIADYRVRQQEYMDTLSPRTRAAKARELDEYLHAYVDEPPTPRQYDLMRKTYFQEMMQNFARVNNCRARIAELKTVRVSAVVRRREAGAQADFVHHRLVRLEEKLMMYERTLDYASALMQRRERADTEWKDAKELIVMAESDRRKAEMACVGLNEQIDSAENVLRLRNEETVTLLRQKIIMERESKRLSASIHVYDERAVKLKGEMEEEDEKVVEMMYRKRGAYVPTPYGCGTVVHYREEDDMVVVQMKYGKLYMQPVRSFTIDRGIQQAERVQMEVEDALTRAYVTHEKEVAKRERNKMSAEEDVCQKMMVAERDGKEMRVAVEAAGKDEERLARAVLASPDGKALVKARADKVVADALAKRKAEMDGWRGKKQERPKQYTARERGDIRARAEMRVAQDFVAEFVMARKAVAARDLNQRRREKAEVKALEYVVESLLQPFIHEVAHETLQIGLETRIRAQVESGIVFMDPPHMQFGVYSVLKKRWIDRREFLRNSVELMMARSGKSMEEARKQQAKYRMLDAAVQARKVKDAEDKRQIEVCMRMAEEEEFCRKFYRDELLLCLKERRIMAQEERYTRMYLLMVQRQEELRKQAQPGDKPVKIVTRHQMRRLELKERAAERMREEKESMLMIGEDKYSQALRVYVRLMEQRRRLEEEGKRAQAWLDSMDDDDYSDDDGIDVDPVEDADVMASLPPEVEELTLEEQEKMILSGMLPSEVEQRAKQRKREIRRRKKRVRSIVEAARRARAAERTALAQWQAMYEASMVKSMRVELAWMEAEEEARLMRFELKTLEENLRKLNLLTQRKSSEEIKAKQELRAKKEHRDKCVKEREEAVFWEGKCRQLVEMRRKIRARVLEDTRWKDTDVVQGFYQRWPLPALYKRLYWDYFRTLSTILIYRCEATALERRIMKLQEYLVVNMADIEAKQVKSRQLSAGLRRKLLMSYTRSELGRKMFVKARRHVLIKHFQGWVRFMLWQQGFERAFKIRYTLIKHELDLRRLYPETHTAIERSLNTTTTTSTTNAAPSSPSTSTAETKKRAAHSSKFTHVGAKLEGAAAEEEEEEGRARAGDGMSMEVPYVKKTLLMRHKARTLQCRHCRTFYLEDQNQDLACPYHPGEYKIACPRSCPGLSLKCMSHRLKRWTCCDSREESSFMANGCRARRHMAVVDVGTYKEVMEGAEKDWEERGKGLDDEIERRREGNWHRKLVNTAKGQLKAMEDDLNMERRIVAKFDAAKFR